MDQHSSSSDQHKVQAARCRALSLGSTDRKVQHLLFNMAALDEMMSILPGRFGASDSKVRSPQTHAGVLDE
jgi:hypothetical protein